ncbi:hypothetical protein V6C53_08680 [Desulfocurvibacter africanus]|uniref:hypothetical protein n=1 Tax=Desulfocurvibacter africanus TaxID=873 RepID=UPI002FD8C734
MALVGISLVLILAVILFGILPEWHSQDELRARMAELQTELDARNNLRPLRKSLEREKAEAKRLSSLALASEKRPSLPVQEIVPALAKLAGKAGLKDARILPQPETLDAATLTMRVTAVLRGDLESLRRFLLVLAAAPFVQDVETLEISRPDQRLEFAVGLRLKLENTRQGKDKAIENARSGQANDQA